MDLLLGLGVNSTVKYQLVTFLVAYVFLYMVLFKPYYKAYLERVSRTLGQTDLAEKYLLETQSLQAEFERKSRDINNKYKEVYESGRKQAMQEYDQVVGAAKASAKTQVDAAKMQIAGQVKEARQQLEKEVVTVAGVISGRLLGGDKNL